MATAMNESLLSSSHLLNPLNIILVLAILYLAYPITSLLLSKPDKVQNVRDLPDSYSRSYTWLPKRFKPAIVWRSYTPRELEPFNGKDGGRILFAIQGKVYDVSSGRNFYGPGGPYGNFAGRDATRGLAKQSFDEDMLTPIDQPIDKLEGLTPSEWNNLRGGLKWFSRAVWFHSQARRLPLSHVGHSFNIEWQSHFGTKYIICGQVSLEFYLRPPVPQTGRENTELTTWAGFRSPVISSKTPLGLEPVALSRLRGLQASRVRWTQDLLRGGFATSS